MGRPGAGEPLVRLGLGDRITEWLRQHDTFEIVDTIVTQSSDEAFHCLVISLFYHEPLDD